MLLIQHKQSSSIQTGGHLYSDTYPYEVSECSVGIPIVSFRWYTQVKVAGQNFTLLQYLALLYLISPFIYIK